MKTIQRIGLVVDIGRERAEVAVTPRPGEVACRVGCGCCGAGPGRLYVPRGDLEVGDHVRVTLPACSGWLSMLVVLVLPMALFVAGMVAGSAFEAHRGSPGLPTIAGGVLGFALAVLIAVAVNRRITGAHNFVVERIDAETAAAPCPGPLPPSEGPG